MDDITLTGISFPAQTPPQPGSFLTDPKQTQLWITGLIGSPLGRIAHEVYKVLHALNRTVLPVKTRLEVTKLFIEPVLRNTQRLEKYYLNVRFPLSERDRKVAQLNRTLLLELALCFKTLLRDQLAQRTSHTDLALTMQQSLQLHLATLRQIAITYHNYPKNFWRETHQIYAVARASGIQHLEVFNSLAEHPRVLQVEGIYKQIVLFSLSDHYRLRQQDILLILKRLPEWAESAELGPVGTHESQDGLFSLDLDRNTPPLHLSLLPGEPASLPHIILLKTHSLLRHLQRLRGQSKLNNLSGQYESRGIALKTLDHLCFVWETVPPRSSSRTNLRFELALVVGLKQIYMLLHRAQLEHADGRPILPADIASRISSVDDNSGMMVELDSDFWKINESDITHIDELIYLEHDSSKPAWTWQDDTAVTPQNYQIINESSGGYCIRWNNQDAPAIKVGELIGIRNDNNPRLFSIAISRWMKYEREYTMLGIAMTSRSCFPIQARLAHSENTLIQHCILLGENGPNDPLRVAAPPLAFREGQQVTLFNPSLQIHVRLLELLEGTAAFNIFSYEELSLLEGYEEEEGAEDAPAPPADEPADH